MQSLNSVRDSDAGNRRRRSRLTLLLIVAVCAAPIVASYIAYYVWQPSGHVNYGELLEPRPLPDTALTALDGSTFRFRDLKGSWILLVADDARCDDRCRTRLVYMRQIRLAQGKETERIERVWLLTGDGSPPAEVLAGQPGLRVVRAGGSDVLGGLAEGAAGRIHVVDPLGNLMMRFPADPDPRRVLRDLSRLLRHSKWK
jgi:hypothetical protein